MTDTTMETKPKRPILVWILGILGVIFALLGALGLIMWDPNMQGLPPQQAEYMRSFDTVDFVLAGTSIVLLFLGSALLFDLRAIAAHLLGLNLLVSIGHTTLEVLTVPSYLAVATPVTLGINFAIYGALTAYAYWLKAKGTLR